MALSIPLPLLLGIIVGGITALLAALHWVGWSTPATLEGEQVARTQFALDHPDRVVTDVVVGTDGAAALLALADGGLGLVVVLGDRFVHRLLGSGSLAALRVDPDAVHLRLADVGFPRASLVVPDSPGRAAWVDRLSACVGAPVTA